MSGPPFGRCGVRRLGVVIGLLAVLSASATVRSAAQPLEDLRPFAGAGAGAMTGSAASNTGEGSSSAPAQFTMGEDGRWTLTCSGTASGTARRIGSRLILEGKMTAGDPMAVGRTVSLILRLQGSDFLYGYGDSFFSGQRIGAGITLRKVGG